jgi:hypothetical protein
MSILGILTGVALTLLAFWITRLWIGFTAQRPEHYTDAGVAFDPRRDLDGPMDCEGVIYGPLGRVVSRFTGDFNVTWEGNAGVMTEYFHYASGEEQYREWQLTVGNDGSIRARASDLIGEGYGHKSGPTMCLRYKIRLEEDSGGHVLDVMDWMYLAPNGAVVNRSQFRKFGIKVAELVAVMRKRAVA